MVIKRAILKICIIGIANAHLSVNRTRMRGSASKVRSKKMGTVISAAVLEVIFICSLIVSFWSCIGAKAGSKTPLIEELKILKTTSEN